VTPDVSAPVSTKPDWKSRVAALRRPERWRALDRWLRTWGPLLLAIFAIYYYSQYCRSGLNLGGEGGTVAVNAIRLNEGWLPIKDTTLNYNVMWFYPVAWLFKVTGPDYVALRVYFFALCTISGLLGFLIVRRVTRLGWLSLGVGLLILTIPGMQFRNYMALLPLLNVWALLNAFVLRDTRRRWLWFVVAGLALGLTFLVRIDIGLFFTAIYAGLAALYPFGVRGQFWKRLPIAAGGGVLCALAAAAIHWPFYADAQRRGFGPEFVSQYTRIWSYIEYEAGKRFGPKQAEARPSMMPRHAPRLIPVHFQKAPKNWAQLVREARAKQNQKLHQGRPREDLRSLFNQPSFYDALFVIILYLPILVGGLIFVAMGGALAWAILKRDADLKEHALVGLVTLGAALTLFPQYFFFRPDTPHLSEFMVPFLVAMTCASFFAARRALSTRSGLARIAGWSFVALCLVSEGLYFAHSFPKDSAGTIAAKRKRTYEVVADNGVRVLVKRRERPWLQKLHDTIVRYSAPGEWVVTFPYSPTINFMTNRPSYLKDLYVDNATAGKHFTQEKIAELEEFRPAVIVIDQRDINHTEISRFKRWAAPFYNYIRAHYVAVGKFDSNEVYVRPDKAAAAPSGQSPEPKAEGPQT
jgi:hypothetical protein